MLAPTSPLPKYKGRSHIVIHRIYLYSKYLLKLTVWLCILQTYDKLPMCHGDKDNHTDVCKNVRHADHTWAWLLWYIANKVFSSCSVHPVISFYRTCSFHRWTSLQESLTSGVKNAFQSTTLYCLPYAYFMGGETARWKWKRKHPLITSQWYQASLGHRALLLVSIQGSWMLRDRFTHWFMQFHMFDSCWWLMV